MYTRYTALEGETEEVLAGILKIEGNLHHVLY